MNERFPPEVMKILSNCGWYPGRRISDEVIETWRLERLHSDEVDMPAAAKNVLEEFGQLLLTSEERGVDFARLALSFDCDGDGGEYLRNYSNAVGRGPLYPLGSYGDNDGTFLIAQTGEIYVDFRLDAPAGKTLDEALEKLLLGIRW